MSWSSVWEYVDEGAYQRTASRYSRPRSKYLISSCTYGRMSVDVKAGVAQESESVSSREGYIVELIGEVRVLIERSSAVFLQVGSGRRGSVSDCQSIS